jgi:hypothetical protein
MDDPEAVEVFAHHPAWNPLAFEGLPPRCASWGLLALTSRTTSSRWQSDIILSAGAGRVRWPVARRWFPLPAGEFAPEDADLTRSGDADPHPVPVNLDYGDGDAVADNDLFAGLPG